MMVLSALGPEASLPEFLSQRARAASIRRLVLDVVLGAVTATWALWMQPPAWVPLLATGAVFCCYGLWGLLDRAQTMPRITPHPLLGGVVAALSAFVAAAGIIATATLLLGVWALALGTWIS